MRIEKTIKGEKYYFYAQFIINKQFYGKLLRSK